MPKHHPPCLGRKVKDWGSSCGEGPLLSPHRTILRFWLGRHNAFLCPIYVIQQHKQRGGTEVAKQSILARLSVRERVQGEDHGHSVGGVGGGWGAHSRYAALSKHARQFGSDIIMAPVATPHLQAEHTHANNTRIRMLPQYDTESATYGVMHKPSRQDEDPANIW